jgi:hypothetical protein
MRTGYVRANFDNPSRGWRHVERRFDLEAIFPGSARRRVRRLGDTCVTDATTGQQICGGTASVATGAAGSVTASGAAVACSVGVPRWYPPSLQPPNSNAPQNTPSSSSFVAGDGTTWGFISFNSPTLVVHGQNSPSQRFSYNFVYSSGTTDVYQLTSAPCPKFDCTHLMVGPSGAITMGAAPQQQPATFTFQYHAGALDVYYCSATNQWATTSTSGFVLVSMPPAADESQCTSAAAAGIIPSTVPAGTPVIEYAGAEPTYVSPFSTAYPSSGYVATPTATATAAPASSGFLSNIPTWAKIGGGIVGGILLLKYMGKR